MPITLGVKESKFKLNQMAKAKKPVTKKTVVKKPVDKKVTKKKAVTKKKPVEGKIGTQITHQYVPHVPRRIDTIPPPDNNK